MSNLSDLFNTYLYVIFVTKLNFKDFTVKRSEFEVT